METTVILDPGSHTYRAGYAYTNFPNDEEPRVNIPTAVSCIDSSASNTAISYPIQQGRIADFDQFESLTYHILYEQLGWQHGQEGSVIITEPILTSRSDRELVTQLMFEVFNVNGLFLQDQAVLSLYAVGKATGVVVDLGHDKCDIAAVSDGVLSTSSATRLPYGGRDVTNYLGQLLQQHGCSFQLGNLQLEQLKELCMQCEIPSSNTLSNMEEDEPQDTQHKTSYTLPDGQELAIPNKLGTLLGQALLTPSNLGAIQPGPAEAAYDCICNTTSEQSGRRAFLENVLVCGGGSSVPGLTSAFLSDLQATCPSLSITPALCTVPEYLPTASGLRYSSWIGGAVMAKVIQAQPQQLVSKLEYDEVGPTIVHKKCV